MPTNSAVHEFIERAKTNGATDQSIVGILTARGWPEKEVFEALAEHYKRLTGIEVPHRGSAGTPAKDAFFYLLVFSTLAIWTIGLGSLAFSLIDRWLADSLFAATYYQGYETYSIASAWLPSLWPFQFTSWCHEASCWRAEDTLTSWNLPSESG